MPQIRRNRAGLLTVAQRQHDDERPLQIRLKRAAPFVQARKKDRAGTIPLFIERSLLGFDPERSFGRRLLGFVEQRRDHVALKVLSRRRLDLAHPQRADLQPGGDPFAQALARALMRRKQKKETEAAPPLQLRAQRFPGFVSRQRRRGVHASR